MLLNFGEIRLVGKVMIFYGILGVGVEFLSFTTKIPLGIAPLIGAHTSSHERASYNLCVSSGFSRVFWVFKDRSKTFAIHFVWKIELTQIS